jgi:hypothetical protein
MKRNSRWSRAQGVIAAMARASRRTPKINTTDPLNPVNDAHAASPHYLLPILQGFVQQQQQQRQQAPQNFAAESSLASSGTLTAFIEAAHAASETSLAQFQQLLQQQTKERSEAARQEKDLRMTPSESSFRTTSVEGTSYDENAFTQRTFPAQPLPLAWSSKQSSDELIAAVQAYNPTVQPPLLHRIASRLAVSDTLLLARQLVRYLREAAAAEHGSSADRTENGAAEEQSITSVKAMELLQRAMSVCHVRYVNPRHAPPDVPSVVPSTRTAPWAFTTAARESAGVGLRFHHAVASLTPHGQRRRRLLPRCFLRYVSDIQVNEVLPNGAVVVFTHPTHPAEVGDRATDSQVNEAPSEEATVTAHDGKRRTKQAKNALPSFRESLEACLASSPAEVYVHGVLYRCGVPMNTAVADLIAAAEGLIRREDLHVNLAVPEDGEYVVVQLCSIRVVIPHELRGQGYSEEVVQHCLHVTRAIASVNVASDVTGEGKTSPVGFQLLYCRPHPCAMQQGPPRGTGSAAASQLQYALLLRGFEQRGGPINQLDRTALLCSEKIPNFFSPCHFGPPDVPFFRTYHVTAALENGRYAEAAAMMLCLACGAEAPVSSALSLSASWLAPALQLLCCGEEREGVWQAWWKQRVPADVQARLLTAKAELVWNVLASCRLQELAAATNGRVDALLASTPAPGDFVCRSARGAEEERERGEDDDDAPRASVPPPDEAHDVLPIFSQAEAVQHTIYDIVLPVVCDAADTTTGCDSVAELETKLGFTPPRRRRRFHQQTSLSFRPLLARATGSPRATRPWARSFQEPSSPAAADKSPILFSLATDWELASGSRQERDYAAKSRGPRAQVWPLSKRGRALSDRLPVGLLAVASANGSSLLRNGTSSPHCHGSRCLAIHCTLPADVSLGSYLCEFTNVEDLRRVS